MEPLISGVLFGTSQRDSYASCHEESALAEGGIWRMLKGRATAKDNLENATG